MSPAVIVTYLTIAPGKQILKEICAWSLPFFSQLMPKKREIKDKKGSNITQPRGNQQRSGDRSQPVRVSFRFAERAERGGHVLFIHDGFRPE